MIKDTLEVWGAKIPPQERFVVYFIMPGPTIKLMSLGQVLYKWDSYIEECIGAMLEDIDQTWDLDRLYSEGCDLILEQVRSRAKYIDNDVVYIINGDIRMDMRAMLEELEDDGHLSELIRDKMTEIFHTCLQMLKEAYNEQRESQREDREVVGTHTQV